MRRCKRLAVCLAAGLLAGCAETPSAEIDEISRLDKNSSSAEDRRIIRKIAVSALAEDADAVQKAQTGTFVLKDVFLPETDSVITCRLNAKHTAPDAASFRQICQSLLGTAPDAAAISLYSDDIALTDETLLGPDTKSTAVSALHLHFPVCAQSWRAGEDDKPSLSLTDTGKISFSRGFDMVVSPYLLDTIQAETVYRDKEWADTVRTMYDGNEWRTADCARYAAEIFQAIRTDSFFTYQPFRVTVRKIGEKYGYWILMQRTAPDGLPVYPFYELSNSPVNPKTDSMLQDASWCWCVRKDEVQELEKAQDFVVSEQTEIDSLIPLSDAKRIAEQALAAQRSYPVTACLCHCIRLYGSKVSAITEHEFADAFAYSDYEKTVLEPYWVFTEADGEHEVRYLVNAQTGAFEIR